MCSHLQGGHGWGDTVGDKHKGRGLHGAACGAGEMQGVCGRRRSVAHAKALHVGAQRSTRDMQGVCRRASCTVRGALHVGARCSTERGFACGTYNGFALTSPTTQGLHARARRCTSGVCKLGVQYDTGDLHVGAQRGTQDTQGVCMRVHSTARGTRKGFAHVCVVLHLACAMGLHACPLHTWTSAHTCAAQGGLHAHPRLRPRGFARERPMRHTQRVCLHARARRCAQSFARASLAFYTHTRRGLHPHVPGSTHSRCDATAAAPCTPCTCSMCTHATSVTVSITLISHISAFVCQSMAATWPRRPPSRRCLWNGGGQEVTGG